MENENKLYPKAASISRDWFESAKKVLDIEQLRCVLLCAVEYVLYGNEPVGLDEKAFVVFTMIIPYLDFDIFYHSNHSNKDFSFH